MDFTADIVKVDSEKRRVFGWAYVAQDSEGRIQIDKQGDFIDDPEELEKAAYEFVVESRRGDAMHFKRGVAELIESFVFTPEKMAALGVVQKSAVPQLAWWIGMQVNDDETWELVKDETFKGFSIGGGGNREKAEA